MSTTAVLGITQMVSSQENKHVTFNDAIGDLELIASRLSLAVSPTTGTMTLTADQSRVGLLELTGTLTGALAVEFFAGLANLVVVYNGTAGAFALTVKMAGNATTITIPKGCAVPVRLGTSVALDKRQSIPMAKLQVSLGADQTIVVNTDTRVDFDTVDYDNASGWDSTNKKYVCPVAGWYQVSAAVHISSSGGVTSGTMASYIGLRKNGSLYQRGNRMSDAGNTTATEHPVGSWLILCAAGDTLDIIGRQGKTATTMKFNGIATNTWFAVRCVELA